MTITVVLIQMIKLFLLMCLGGILYKLDIIDDHTRQHVTKLVLHVTMPTLIVYSFIQNMGAKGGADLSVLFAVSVALYALLPVAAVLLILLLRVRKSDQGLYMFITVYSNVGFMGFPVVEALYGNEGLFYAAVFNCIFNISIFTMGVAMMRYKGKPATDVKSVSSGKHNKTGNASVSAENTSITAPKGGNSSAQSSIAATLKKLLSPGILCCITAILIYLSGWKVPELVTDVLGTVGGLTSPLAMLLVGASLSSMNMKEMFGDLRMLLYTLLRQFALPLASWPLIHACIGNRVLAIVTLLMVAMPVGNTAVLFSTEYDADEKLAAKGVFLSTLLALLSIPFVLWICAR